MLDQHLDLKTKSLYHFGYFETVHLHADVDIVDPCLAFAACPWLRLSFC